MKQLKGKTSKKELKKITEIIIQAVPGIRQQMDTRGEVFTERDISLEDVLLALDRNRVVIDRDFGISGVSGEFIEIASGGLWTFPSEWKKLGGFPNWQMEKPLHKQSRITINFLYSLLTIKTI